MAAAGFWTTPTRPFAALHPNNPGNEPIAPSRAPPMPMVRVHCDARSIHKGLYCGGAGTPCGHRGRCAGFGSARFESGRESISSSGLSTRLKARRMYAALRRLFSSRIMWRMCLIGSATAQIPVTRKLIDLILRSEDQVSACCRGSRDGRSRSARNPVLIADLSALAGKPLSSAARQVRGGSRKNGSLF